VGIVTRSGPDVVHIKEGDRVAVHLAETVELHVDGRTEVVTESRQLEQVNESFEQIQKGEVDARLVFDFR
jgi:D-arabinose 1-dehydrogenase-like Zn-dependent alcohol dehydrogenase